MLCAQVFDRAEALARVDGDEEFLKEIAELFLAECPRYLQEIGDALHAADAGTLGRAAHTLKGAVGNFVAAPAFEAAFALERLARAGDLDGSAEAFAAVRREVEHLQAALAEVVHGDALAA
jgi:two-component system sensor histidine kinase/response regulator